MAPPQREAGWGRLRSRLVEFASVDSGGERGPLGYGEPQRGTGGVLAVPDGDATGQAGHLDTRRQGVAAGRLPPRGGSRVTCHECPLSLIRIVLSELSRVVVREPGNSRVSITLDQTYR